MFIYNVSACDVDTDMNGVIYYMLILIYSVSYIKSYKLIFLIHQEQYIGMFIYDVSARDVDTGMNGVIDYMLTLLYSVSYIKSLHTVFSNSPGTVQWYVYLRRISP